MGRVSAASRRAPSGWWLSRFWALMVPLRCPESTAAAASAAAAVRCPRERVLLQRPFCSTSPKLRNRPALPPLLALLTLSCAAASAVIWYSVLVPPSHGVSAMLMAASALRLHHAIRAVRLHYLYYDWTSHGHPSD